MAFETFARQAASLGSIAASLSPRPNQASVTLEQIWGARATLADTGFDTLDNDLVAARDQVLEQLDICQLHVTSTTDLVSHLARGLQETARHGGGADHATVQGIIAACSTAPLHVVYVVTPTMLVPEFRMVLAHSTALSPRYHFVALAAPVAAFFADNCIFATGLGPMLDTDTPAVFETAEMLIDDSGSDSEFRDAKRAFAAARAAAR